MDTSYAKISEIISQAKPESVFVASDFSHIAPINTVRQCLSWLEKSQQIVRVMRGVYCQPVYSELLQECEAPSPHHVLMGLARNFGWMIVPSGATVLNVLSLSTQVPVRWSFVSDGPYRFYKECWINICCTRNTEIISKQLEYMFSDNTCGSWIPGVIAQTILKKSVFP